MANSTKSKTLDFLPKGTTVLASVKPDGSLSAELDKHLVKNIRFIKSNNRYTTQTGHFVPITIEKDLTITFKISDSGNILKQLDPCPCKSPALPDKTYRSLNGILQEISRLYEPGR